MTSRTDTGTTTVLVTGAAGNVGGMLRPGLDRYALRTLDTRPAPDWDTADQHVGDITDPAVVAAAVHGVDAVVHLAANPLPTATWAELRAPNADGLTTVLDAAVEAGVPKVVVASSVHAMGGYVRGAASALVEPHWPVQPCCRYGATKAFAEAYGAAIAATTATAVVSLRIGAAIPEPLTEAVVPHWLAPGDLQALVRAAIGADVRNGTYFGISANAGAVFDVRNAREELGYVPTHDSASYADTARPGGDGLCLR